MQFFMTGVNPMHYRNYRYIIAALSAMVAASIISSCSPGVLTYKGAKVTQMNRMILLKQGEQQGVWKTAELSVSYNYQLTPDDLKLNGTTELIGGLSQGFRWIKRLDVYLLFLDRQGVVIECPLIYSSMANRVIDTIPLKFETTLPVPEGTYTVSFAYEGELSGTGARDSTFRRISDSPSRPIAPKQPDKSGAS